MKCLNCNTETNNPKFCSRSCSASYTNKIKPRRQTTRICARPECNNTVKNHLTSLCKEHKKEYDSGRTYKNKTLGDYTSKLSVKGKHPSWVFANVRQFCRSWNKELTLKPCANCGYDKHVELCHIKPLNSFTPDTTLEIINAPENVIQLCRNCHWEFDNGILHIDV